MTDLPRWRRALFLVTAMAVIGVYLRTSIPHGHIRGDITVSLQTEQRLKQLWDRDGNGVLTVAEMRRGLTRVIRGVASGDRGSDVNGDDLLNHDDVVESIRSIKAFLLSTCGNGSVEAGEECDDGNVESGDGCSASCMIESDHATHLECQNRACVQVDGQGENQCAGDTDCSVSLACGNGKIDAGEQCDDGNTVSGDGCSGNGHPNGACMVEFCGDGFADTDGLTDIEGTPLMRTLEQCDEGGRCQGGANDGERCTHFGEDPFCGQGVPCVTVDTGTCTADCQLPH